ncbi:hypothetical protein CWI82_09595 [Pseudidiomarina tainanensis]|uniref:Uncharacterized protein n=1 Tax=Pseudidiomarina tainanensis TaxID=502365 RepID=A0ACD2HGA0_9GAMM|nr:hypothetical protein CWI82_09595 [Pseudidiomarina tainanensis]
MLCEQFMPKSANIRTFNECCSVLVAEDNKTSQLIVDFYLKEFGASTKIVFDGDALLAALEADSFDVVIVDAMMLILDGVNAIEIIRKKKLHDNKPIILLTADAVGVARGKYRKLPIQAVLTKPYTKNELFETISSVVL